MKYYHFPGAAKTHADSQLLAAGGQQVAIGDEAICIAFPRGWWSVLHLGYNYAAAAEVLTTSRIMWARGTTAPSLVIQNALSIEPGRDENIMIDAAAHGTNAITFISQSGAIVANIRQSDAIR